MQGVNIGVNKHHPLTKWSATFMDFSCLANSAVWSGFWKIMTPMNEEWKRQANRRNFRTMEVSCLRYILLYPRVTHENWLNLIPSQYCVCDHRPNRLSLSSLTTHPPNTAAGCWNREELDLLEKFSASVSLFNLMASLWVNFGLQN